VTYDAPPGLDDAAPAATEAAADPGPLVEVVRVYLVTGQVVRWKLSAPTPFLDVVRRLEQADDAGHDITALYIDDAATGQPIYIRMAHIVDIVPEVDGPPTPDLTKPPSVAPWAPQKGGGR
jgi:hypothetical protein